MKRIRVLVPLMLIVTMSFATVFPSVGITPVNRVENSTNIQQNPSFGISEWTPTFNVSVNSTSNSLNPSIAMDSKENLYVVWSDLTDIYGGTDSDIVFRVWNASIEAWTSIQLVSVDSTRNIGSSVVVADSYDNIHFIWSELNPSETAYQLKHRFWNSTTKLWNDTSSVITGTTIDATNPAVCADTKGNLHLVWQDYSMAGDLDIRYNCFNATTNSWMLPQTVSVGSSEDSMRPKIDADAAGDLYVVWYEQTFTSYNIRYNRWNATSGFWQTTVYVTSDALDLNRFPSLRVDEMGNVHIVWAYNYGFNSVKYKKWDNATSAWQPTQIPYNTTGIVEYPEIDVDHYGSILLTWCDSQDDDGEGDYDIKYGYCDSSGTWSNDEWLSVDSTGDTYFPGILISSIGCIHVVWEDRSIPSDSDIHYRQFEVLDGDNDGLSDYIELQIGTDPELIDTDNDNFLDGYEYEYGTDPLDPLSYPGMPQDWYDAIYSDLNGNASLIQQVITWMEGNYSDIQALFTMLDGNASLLVSTVNALNENATLISNLVTWSGGNATLLLSVAAQVEAIEPTDLTQIIAWLDGNHSAIETLFTYVEGNATLLLDVVYDLSGNATRLELIAALATQNTAALNLMNASMIGDIDEIRAVLEQLGVTVGDSDYDGLDDLDEIAHGTDIQCIDSDTDNLNDAFEIKLGTNPLDDDSDADTYLDGIEVIAGTDPLDPLSYPGSIQISTTMLILGVGSIGFGVIILGVLYKKRDSILNTIRRRAR